MSRIYVCGLGAVSPAGWGLPALRAALDKSLPLSAQPLERPGSQPPFRALLVPPPPVRPAFLAHPRLRRTSPITHYAAAAALEAVAALRSGSGREARLGVVACMQVGCVNFSCRFYDEALKDPATASPLLFPETVYAAPASHVAALLDNTPLVYSLVGDPACFLQGIALGIQWLEQGRVDACLVFGAEETHWIIADALWRLERPAVFSAGAGALCLTRDASKSLGIELAAITSPVTFSTRTTRAQAARAMRAELEQAQISPADLLCDGLAGVARADAAESAAWRDWTGARLSPKRILGEGLTAAAAWQCVAACDAVAAGRFPAAAISLVGSNQQAIGARVVQTSGFQLVPI
jgi:3-oxoacyl-(acyl-carrier-protein) synthase